jgi:hypothetical protein
VTKGEEIVKVECYCLGNNIGMEPCMPCRVDAAIVEVQTKFKAHMDDCSKGFWGRLATKQSKEIQDLKRQLSELKKQVAPSWE